MKRTLWNTSVAVQDPSLKKVVLSNEQKAKLTKIVSDSMVDYTRRDASKAPHVVVKKSTERS